VVQPNRRWYLSSAGRVSRVVSERVAALISLSRLPAAVAARRALSGRVKPSHAREVVPLQQRFGRRWRKVARVHLRRAHALVDGPTPILR
jgi:hypothetical protein